MAVAALPRAYALSMRQLYTQVIADVRDGKAGTIHPELYRAYSENLRWAVSGVFSPSAHEDRYSDMRNQFEANTARFAAYKAFHVTQQLQRQLADSEGVVRSPEEFDRMARAVLNTFNRYQAAEYNTAVARARTAKQWADFSQGDNMFLFPNIRWLPSRSANPREQHMPFYNRVWAKTDSFWNSNQPGNLWNCKCDWEETDDPVTADNPEGIRPARGLEGNPAETGQIFTDKCTYIDRAGAKGDEAVREFMQTISQPNQQIPTTPPQPQTPQQPGTNPANNYQLKAKTVKEAEIEIAQNLGVICNFKGFTKNDLSQIQEIYSSVATHLDKYPALKNHINFVGSMQGRKALFYDKFYQELKAKYPTFPDASIQRMAKSYANQYASIPSRAYAYSAPSKKFDLNGVAFNASYKGDKVKKTLNSDLKAKWHPEGCNTVKSVFDHELGHKIDETLGLKSDPEFLKIFTAAEKQGKAYIKDNLSEYAYKQANTSSGYNPKEEFIAEAWSEYLNNPTPRPIAKSVGDLIVKKTNWKK